MSNNSIYTLDEFKKKVFYDMNMSTSDAVILMCAILIASIGLNMNSTAVVIGAMLISPLMSPIIGIGLSLSIYNYSLLKKSFKILSFQIIISVLISTLYFYISPISYPSAEIVARTTPTIWDVVIAIAGGTAGIIGSRKKDANNIVPGVAIATALMPPICTVGYSIASGNLSYLLGSSYLFIINCSFIIISTLIGVRIMMPVNFDNEEDEKSQVKFRVILLIVSILIVIPSIFSAATLVRRTITEDAVSSFVSDRFKNYLVLDESFNKNDNSLTMTISGEYLSKDEVDKIKKSMKEYNLEDVTLNLNQIPSLDKIDDKKLNLYINKYFQMKIEKESKSKK